MFSLTKSETVPLTRDMAEKFRDMEGSPTERELTLSHVRYLTGQFANEHAVAFNWATAEFEGKLLRMNGQHSSTALCDLNGGFPQSLKVHLDTYKAENKDDLATLFRQFDSRKSAHSGADVAGAFQMNEPSLRGIPRDIAKLGIDGVKWYRDNVLGTPTPSGDDAYSLFSEDGLLGFLLWQPEVFNIKTPELRFPAVAAAMHATFRVGETAARDFWLRVARGGAGYDDNAPETMLDAWLKNLKENPDSRKALQIKAGNYYQGSIFAWNAFRDSKTIKTVKYDIAKGFLDPL